MGRPPKPTALKKLQGNPGKRPLNEREPMPMNRRPNCPRWLSEEAKREWRRLARPLHEAGLLTFVDRDVLAMYCESLARWIRAEQRCLESGDVLFTSNGNMVQNPWLGIANRSKKDTLTIMARLGLDPAMRSRIKLPEMDKDVSLADQLFEAIKRND